MSVRPATTLQVQFHAARACAAAIVGMPSAKARLHALELGFNIEEIGISIDPVAVDLQPNRIRLRVDGATETVASAWAG